MATQSVIHPARQSKLAVVPPAPQAITQLELTVLLSLRRRLHQLQKQVEAAEKSIQARLGAGAHLESGDHRAALTKTSRTVCLSIE